MVRSNSCPLCSGNDLVKYLTCTDHLVSKKEFDLTRCSSCGFIFTSNPPEEKEIGAYYESPDYISHSDSKVTLLDIIYQAVRRIMLFSKRRLVSRTNNNVNGRILDIGCGTGHFLNEMKRNGWQTSGVEINEKAREYAVTKFNLDIRHPDALKNMASGEYDCITLWHVLEHFHEPFEYFREIKRLLKPGGSVIVALPNSGSFDAKHYGKNWAAFDVPRHLWHFNTDTFARFASGAGFKIVSFRMLPFDVFYISILSEKQKGTTFPFTFGLAMGKMYFLTSLMDPKSSSSVIYILKDSDI